MRYTTESASVTLNSIKGLSASDVDWSYLTEFSEIIPFLESLSPGDGPRFVDELGDVYYEFFGPKDFAELSDLAESEVEKIYETAAKRFCHRVLCSHEREVLKQLHVLMGVGDRATAIEVSKDFKVRRHLGFRLSLFAEQPLLVEFIEDHYADEHTIIADPDTQSITVAILADKDSPAVDAMTCIAGDARELLLKRLEISDDDGLESINLRWYNRQVAAITEELNYQRIEGVAKELVDAELVELYKHFDIPIHHQDVGKIVLRQRGGARDDVEVTLDNPVDVERRYFESCFSPDLSDSESISLDSFHCDVASSRFVAASAHSSSAVCIAEGAERLYRRDAQIWTANSGEWQGPTEAQIMGIAMAATGLDGGAQSAMAKLVAMDESAWMKFIDIRDNRPKIDRASWQACLMAVRLFAENRRSRNAVGGSAYEPKASEDLTDAPPVLNLQLGDSETTESNVLSLNISSKRDVILAVPADVRLPLDVLERSFEILGPKSRQDFEERLGAKVMENIVREYRSDEDLEKPKHLSFLIEVLRTVEAEAYKPKEGAEFIDHCMAENPELRDLIYEDYNPADLTLGEAWFIAQLEREGVPWAKYFYQAGYRSAADFLSLDYDTLSNVAPELDVSLEDIHRFQEKIRSGDSIFGAFTY